MIALLLVSGIVPVAAVFPSSPVIESVAKVSSEIESLLPADT